jgi:hypothetical protein
VAREAREPTAVPVERIVVAEPAERAARAATVVRGTLFARAPWGDPIALACAR